MFPFRPMGDLIDLDLIEPQLENRMAPEFGRSVNEGLPGVLTTGGRR